MGIEVLFGILIIGFLAVWSFWLYGISGNRRTVVIGGGLGVVGLTIAILIVNGNRVDDQREAYAEQMVALIDLVEVEQEEAFASEGEYAEELSATTSDAATWDEGRLTNEREIETTLTSRSDSYTVETELEGQVFALEVDRGSGGGDPQQTRTCDSPASPCAEGTWDPSG